MVQYKFGVVMHKIQLDQDIQPLSEFRSRVAFYFDKVKKNKRPLVITQNGKSSAVILDVSEYQSMVDKIEVLEDIKLAETQIDQGLGISHLEIKKKYSKKA
jgi:prevent-host-death family protein